MQNLKTKFKVQEIKIIRNFRIEFKNFKNDAKNVTKVGVSWGASLAHIRLLN